MIPAERVYQPGLRNLVDYLIHELRTTQGARYALEQDWIRFQRAYRHKPEQENKTFPFPNASNLVIPLIATDVDTTVASLLGILFGPPNLWTARPLRPDMVDFAPRVQEFMRWAQNEELDMYPTCVEWIMEIAKLGTGVLKQRYTREQKRVYEFREVPGGVVEQHVLRMVKDRPDVRRVPLSDFYIPPGFADHQTAPWCAERISLTWGQLQTRVRSGLYTGIDRLGFWWQQQQRVTRGAMYEAELQRMENFVPQHGARFELYEFWTDYDIEASGEPAALVCTIHPDSGTYLRVDYNPFFHQERPFSVARFLRQEGSFYGIGIGHMLDQFQDAISTMNNQRIDNNTIKNAAVFKAKRGGSVKVNTPIYPGAKVWVDNMDELETMFMGQPIDNTLQAENWLVQFARRRVGSNDYVEGGVGEPSVGYATATTVVQMMKQGKLRGDHVLREIRKALSETGTRVLELYQQFNQGGKPFWVLGDKDGAAVQQVLQFPLELIRAGINIDVTATDASLSKEVEIRTNQVIFNLVLQFYQQMMQGMSIVVNPQVPEPLRQLAYQMVQGGTLVARGILEAYGRQDVDRIIPDISEALNNGQSQLNLISAALSRGGQLGPGSVPPSGVPAGPGVPAGAPPSGNPVYGTGGGGVSYLPQSG